MIWELTFLADKDMRPAVFDFATNGLKPFNSIKKTKSRSCFLEKLLRSSL
jgi:ABC-2 type transport system ATP-binding protein